MKPIPYGRQNISEDDVLAVQEVLNSDWLLRMPLMHWEDVIRIRKLVLVITQI